MEPVEPVEPVEPEEPVEAVEAAEEENREEVLLRREDHQGAPHHNNHVQALYRHEARVPTNDGST